ncbi:G-protein alpha subunit-domain-containing protein [Mycena latifolia]|nr:G-protein alpha subunit-domain-containing protein [Mycena latifolia]
MNQVHDVLESGSTQALVPLVALQVSSRPPGALVKGPEGYIGPGRILYGVYSTLAVTAERHANRAAHILGLGPAAVAERIRIAFGYGGQRELALNELPNNVPRKVEKDCGRLMHYALRTESSSTQLEAFKSLVTLTTRYPGLRRIFLSSEDISNAGAEETEIAGLWERTDESGGAQWHFFCRFAAACLADRDLSSLVEDIPPQSFSSVAAEESGLSIIEQLLVSSDCEGTSSFSGHIAIRYLGGILELPSFWGQTGTLFRSVVQKLLARAELLLKDLGVDSPGADDSTTRVQSDIEGIDIFCEVLLAGIQTWLPDQSSRATIDEGWYPSLRHVLDLLRQPKAQDLLPRSWTMATTGKFQEVLPSDYESRLVDIIVPAERPPDRAESTSQPVSASKPIKTRKNALKRQKTHVKPPTTANPPAEMRAKVLLLGSGDSGKSTILKQMHLVAGVHFSEQELESYRQTVFDNLMYLRHVLDSLPALGLHLPETLRSAAGTIAHAPDLRDGEPFPTECLQALTALWDDATVQRAVSRGNEIPCWENFPYLFAALSRIFSPSYVPTLQDILHLWVRTSGVTETTLNLNGIEMSVVDVGGAKSERRKWIHTFNDVASIIFTVSLTAYDMCLIEDKHQNQMQDSMDVWDSICAARWLQKAPIILCFTKHDLFKKKVLTSDIATFFPNFNGARGDAVAGHDYFRKRFLRLANKAGRVNEKEVYIHTATATDTGMMRVFLQRLGTFHT